MHSAWCSQMLPTVAVRQETDSDVSSQRPCPWLNVDSKANGGFTLCTSTRRWWRFVSDVWGRIRRSLKSLTPLNFLTQATELTEWTNPQCISRSSHAKSMRSISGRVQCETGAKGGLRSRKVRWQEVRGCRDLWYMGCSLNWKKQESKMDRYIYIKHQYLQYLHQTTQNIYQHIIYQWRNSAFIRVRGNFAYSWYSRKINTNVYIT